MSMAGGRQTVVSPFRPAQARIQTSALCLNIFFSILGFCAVCGLNMSEHCGQVHSGAEHIMAHYFSREKSPTPGPRDFFFPRSSFHNEASGQASKPGKEARKQGRKEARKQGSKPASKGARKRASHAGKPE